MKRSVIIPAHRMGKGEMMRRLAEKALDEGKTICFATTDGNGGVNYETRGAGVARDVTPTTKLIENK
ncbi:MAG: hypothetical protein ABL931_13720 [Usitatibacteraceae bacterium]